MNLTAASNLVSKFEMPRFYLLKYSEDALIVGRVDGEVQIWDGESGKLVYTLPNPYIFAISYSGRFYVNVEWINSYKLVLHAGRVHKEGLTETNRSHPDDFPSDPINCIAVSDEREVALGVLHDIRVYLCKRASGNTFYNVEKVLHCWDRPQLVRIEINGDFIHAEDSNQTYILWNWRDSVIINEFKLESIPTFLWNDFLNARLLVKSDYHGKSTIDLVDRQSSKTIVSLYFGTAVDKACMSAYGNFIATAHRVVDIFEINIWSVPSGKLLATVKDAPCAVNERYYGVRISPSGKYLVAFSIIGSTQYVRCWKIHSP